MFSLICLHLSSAKIFHFGRRWSTNPVFVWVYSSIIIKIQVQPPAFTDLKNCRNLISCAHWEQPENERLACGPQLFSLTAARLRFSVKSNYTRVTTENGKTTTGACAVRKLYHLLSPHCNKNNPRKYKMSVGDLKAIMKRFRRRSKVLLDISTSKTIIRWLCGCKDGIARICET